MVEDKIVKALSKMPPTGWSHRALAVELVNRTGLGYSLDKWHGKLKNALSRKPGQASYVALKAAELAAIEEVLGLVPGSLRDDSGDEPRFADPGRFDLRRSLEPPMFVRELPTYTNLGRKIPVAETGYRIVPVYGGVPAGEPGRSFSDAADFIEMPEWGGEFLRWGRFVEGDSMEEEFNDGDIVIFENRRALNRNAVHAMKDGEDAFKILVERRPGVGELWPTNAERKPFSAEGWTILGVAIRRIRRLANGDEDERKYKNGYMWKDPVPEMS